MQQVRVGTDRPEILIQLQPADDRLVSGYLQLRMEQLDHALQSLIHLHRLQLRMRHLRKLAEAANDRLEVGDLGKQGGQTLAEYLVELLGTLCPGAHQVLNRELKRKQRIFQLMGQSA